MLVIVRYRVLVALQLLSILFGCVDTKTHPNVKHKRPEHHQVTIFDYIKLYSYKYSVPYEFIYQIGINEGGKWNYPDSIGFVLGCGIPGEISFGDTQLNIPNSETREYLRMHFGLDTITRVCLLETSVRLMKYHYDRTGSWYKTRYCYARWRFKHPNKWSKLENEFMSKYNWKSFDHHSLP